MRATVSRVRRACRRSVPSAVDRLVRSLTAPIARLARSPAAVGRAATERRADVDSLLHSLGLLADRPGSDAEGSRLDPSFRRAWRARMGAIRDDGLRAELAARLDLDPARLALEVTADGVAATDGRRRVGNWPSEAALLADLAAAAALAERAPEWRRLDDRDRAAVIAGLRTRLERCPGCNGTTVEPDPGPATDAERLTEISGELACEHCGSRLVRAGPVDGSGRTKGSAGAAPIPASRPPDDR